ncbi:MAG: hypothetical protein HXM71_05950 [Mogibacterium diversum]|uniref:Uncharacterized protein n=1 Tax=Mogibacterium diversum TaxID=114527 RepID=A0A930HB49_9FIRM|nr:hypothetical protein [Mogibacterium diversum]
MRSVIDGALEGFALSAIIILPLIPIMLLYDYFLRKCGSRGKAILCMALVSCGVGFIGTLVDVIMA